MLDKFINYYSDTFIPLSIQILNLNFNFNEYTSQNSNDNSSMEYGFKISWTGQESFDNSINAMKSRCLVFLNYFIELHKSTDFSIDILRLFSGLVEPFKHALSDVINTKYNLLSGFDQVIAQMIENNYQKLIYEILVFLAQFLSKQIVVNEFKPYINK